MAVSNWIIQNTLKSLNGSTIQQSHFFNEGIVGSEKLYMCDQFGKKEIFIDFGKKYEISLTVTVTDFFSNTRPTAYDGFVEIEFQVGSLPLVTKKIKVSTYDRFITFNFLYQPTDFDLQKPEGRTVWLRRTTPGTLKIVDSNVISTDYVYDESLNNKLYDTLYTTTNPLTQQSEEFFNIPEATSTGNVMIYVGSKNGDSVSVKFGNGRFKKGVWKTGVWNDGWRGVWDDVDDLFYFDKINLNTFQLNSNMWSLKIDSYPNLDNFDNINNNIFVNDFISLSNVVGIDMNEERYLLKDIYRISDIIINGSVVTLVIEVPVAKFPLRRFEIDSPNHLVCVTRNIWLGGTFLNGYFRGVWNYGLFKGFPYTTVMEQSHMVSGKFDGGRFISRITSITSSTGDVREYQTGLVQFFEFFDNNISEKETYNNFIDNTYQSWMDLNYYTQSFVNLNSLTSIYDDNFRKKVPLPNLYGYPTLDVLSSYSKFKNTTDEDVDYYNLGTKYKVYTDYLSENGYFRSAFNSEGRPGLDEFISAGWTANQGNFYGTPTISFFYNSNITRKNFNRFSIILATFGYNVLNNNNINVDDRKYIIVEYDLEYFNRGQDPLTLEFTNSFTKPLTLLGSNYNSKFNVFKSGIIKTEYFYNKNALDLILKYNSEYQPPAEAGLAMFGYNFTYSTFFGSGGEDGEVSTSYSTTYSILFPKTSIDFINDLDWSTTSPKYPYKRGDVARRPTGEALGNWFISLIDNNTSPVTDPTAWVVSTVGFNDPYKEFTSFESSNFDFFTSARIGYFKFLEVDALPFFKYFDFEINFYTTVKKLSNVGLEFTKPHGLKPNDTVVIQLDETRFNPNYETQSTVKFVQDGPLSVTDPGSDVAYTVTLNLPFGNTATYLGESGTVIKSGDRIDKRIQTVRYATAPKISGLDENFVYLGNNQIVVDRDVLD